MVGSKFVADGKQNIILTLCSTLQYFFHITPEEEAGLDRSSHSESAYN